MNEDLFDVENETVSRGNCEASVLPAVYEANAAPSAILSFVLPLFLINLSVLVPETRLQIFEDVAREEHDVFNGVHATAEMRAGVQMRSKEEAHITNEEMLYVVFFHV